MKKRDICLLILAGLITATAVYMWAHRPADTVPVVSHGTLERHVSFESRNIQPRTVTVWLPEGYTKGEPCDVLYMHDGQMLFDSTTTWNHQEWQVDEVMSRLIREEKIRRTIVVAIDNTDERLNEYFPAKAWQYTPEDQRQDTDIESLKGDAYLKFLVEELKPYIDEHYQPLTAREHTFIMGSSMGGLISLYALCEYPQVFGGAACMSSHLSMEHLNEMIGLGMDNEIWANAFFDYLRAHIPAANGSLLYMDHGSEDFDANYAPYQEQVDNIFTRAGWDGKHYMSRVYDGDGHNETCWAQRLHIPLTYLLSK